MSGVPELLLLKGLYVLLGAVGGWLAKKWHFAAVLGKRVNDVINKIEADNQKTPTGKNT
jgi:hypothetical protein